ncbi:hypothetical protein COF37_21420 [Bacillus wiedmannii]|uniref:hypothetical protein n=1 Tax=Bacillus wiedmannii TaxID=1890302 RepID=UPI000BFBB802|nr:hypothetical protein [Bacillus wiedmannii]PHD21299.1 hypothetical protein COF37_21420 [Bacillus wiedmannii]
MMDTVATSTVTTPQEELLHTIKAVDGTDFIVTHSEVDSLLKRIELSGASPSIESLHHANGINFYDDLILVPRHKLDRFRKRYKTLQVLRETDKYVWLVRNELFKETVAREIQTPPKRGLLDVLDEEILNNKVQSNRLARQLLK